MLFIRLPTLVNRCRAQLRKPVAQLSVRPVEPFRSSVAIGRPRREAQHLLWVGGISQTEGGELQSTKTSRLESDTPKRSPEPLSVCRQFALARGGDGDDHDLVFEEVVLRP